jgi:glycosyltransferase involved in cell wall biosynthesis
LKKKRIKIIRILSRLNIGGPALHTILLTEAMNNERFHSILVKGVEAPLEGNMMYYAKQKGVKPIIINEMGRDISLIKDIISLLKIYRIIKLEKPDIVHTHTAKAGFLGRFVVMLYNLNHCFHINSDRSKIIVFHTYHGNVLSGYFGKIKSSVFIYIEKFLSRFTTNIICITKLQKQEIISFGITKPEHVVTIPLGLELHKFLTVNSYSGQLRNELGVDNKTVLIGIVARLVPIKNHMLFLNGILYLSQKYVNRKIKALIIGDGECRTKLEKFVEKSNLRNLVYFLGFRKDLERIYTDLDIVALTSDNEGSPVALIEAMTSNIPVITTNVGGVGDLLGVGESPISPGEFITSKCGLIINPGDHFGFSKALEFMFDNPVIRFQMGLNARKMVYPKYDISRLIKNMEFLYNSHIQNIS